MAFSRIFKRKRDIALITDASSSRIRNYNHRRHVYALLQWSRLPLLLACGAVIMWTDWKWLAAILLIISVPLPWIAVVIANGVGEPEDKRAPRVYKPGVARQQRRQWEQEQAQLEDVAAKQLSLPVTFEAPTNDQPAQRPPAPNGPEIIDMPEDVD